MGREQSMKPDYKVLAYVTTNKDRVIASAGVALFATSEKDANEMTVDIAKGLKADVVQLTNGDYMVIRV
ncbi:hypothetical protein NC797_14115 [Aquibacillus sp. 3ASR75-11]|uniref:Uncharacterized protein n=1 Tax=Terrihalobacillus insolitus TaxID=2950438 RepID=A0A9X3WYC3_9BACI|nr:hypothetical protein [Terrihalobacillus insolitus]MDC3414804.1 hypothetical protein [Terrihalobacillus insolitus]MDC3425639.1 hypothetical protein [Terrihalobacillus insolitus]